MPTLKVDPNKRAKSRPKYPPPAPPSALADSLTDDLAPKRRPNRAPPPLPLRRPNRAPPPPPERRMRSGKRIPQRAPPPVPVVDAPRPVAPPLPTDKASHLTDADVTSTSSDGVEKSANAVTKYTYNKLIGESGTNVGYFKGAAASDNSQDAVAAGIDPTRGADLGTRAVRSARLDRALGTHVLSDERYAEHDGVKGSVSAHVDGDEFAKNVWQPAPHIDAETYQAYAEMGMTHVKDNGDGTYSQLADVTYNTGDLKRAKTQKGLANLSFVDYLSGQVDRHAGNIKMTADGTVKGFDNDLSFGDNNTWTKPAEGEGSGMANQFGLPSQIDRATADTFMGMSRKEYRKVLRQQEGDSGRKLSRSEKKAAMKRRKQMRKHIKGLRKAERKGTATKHMGLIDTWDNDTFAAGTSDVRTADGKVSEKGARVKGAAQSYLARQWLAVEQSK